MLALAGALHARRARSPLPARPPEEVRVRSLALGVVGGWSGTLGAVQCYSLSTEKQQIDRQAVIDGYEKVFPGVTPTPEELQIITAIGHLESQGGRGWSGAMVGSNNWGAVQAKCKPDEDGNCCPGSAPYGDSRPTPEGQVKYTWCYKTYATPADGAADIIKTIYRWPNVVAGIRAGNLDEVSWQMRLNGYYEGFTTDKREAARTHAATLDCYVQKMAAALGEPVAAWRKGEDYVPGVDDFLGGGSGDDGWIAPVAAVVVALLVAAKYGYLARWGLRL